ncbi:hypothetical protein AAMO2058_001530100 [Amorphochlora amoebiformis]
MVQKTLTASTTTPSHDAKSVPLVSSKSPKEVQSRGMTKVNAKSFPLVDHATLAISCTPDLTARVAMKNDAFLPSDESEISSSDSETSRRRRTCGRICPSCSQRVRLWGADYHAHLFCCLQTRAKARGKATTNNLKHVVKSVKEAISNLDLTFRINTMESLYRMAKSAGGLRVLVPELKEEVDNKVLGLVYGKQRSQSSSTLSSSKPLSSQQKKRKRGGSSAGRSQLDNSKRRKKELLTFSRVTEAHQTPPVPAVRSPVLRRFSPLALDDVFAMRPYKALGDFEWKKHILSWHENNRSMCPSPISLPQSPFA